MPGEATPLLAVVAGATRLMRGGMIAGALSLGIVVCLGILNEEVLHVPVDAVDLGLRMLLGAGAMIGIGAGVLEVPRLAWERMLRLRAAERAPAGRRPPAAERLSIEAGPIGLLRGLAVGVLVVAAIGVLVGFGVALSEDLDLAFLLVGAISTVVGAASIAWFRWLGRGPRARWAERLASVSHGWPGSSRRVDPERRGGRANRTLGRRLLHALPGATLVTGLAVFMVGVFTRQQCRTCDPVSYGETGESIVDVLVLVGSVILWVGAAALLLQGATALVVQIVEERGALAAARAGDIARGPMLVRQLVATTALQHVSTLVAVLATLALALSFVHPWAIGMESAEQAAPLQPLDALLLPAIGACLLSLALGTASVIESSSRRAALHAALPGYDPIVDIEISTGAGGQ